METSVRDELIAEWHRNERELVALQDLPVGVEDPATREAALERPQDAIEFAIGLSPNDILSVTKLGPRSATSPPETPTP